MSAGNKYLIADRSILLKSKLDRLSETLNQSVESGDFNTQEQLIGESIKVLNTFYKDLTEPVFDFEELKAGVLPEKDFYNNAFNRILDDLIVVFKELENIEKLTLSNFNYAAIEANRINARIKKVSSDVGDYLLYAVNPTKDVFFFKDSFNSLSKIDIGSALLNSEQCHVNQEEGIITLPIDSDTTELINIQEKVIINESLNAADYWTSIIKTDISKLVDNNADTWFEYSGTVPPYFDSQNPLVLDMTINLGEPKVINHIVVNPYNLGGSGVIEIDDIKTSPDGDEYTSIKDDIPIAGFNTEDEANIFSLAPSTSDYAGQGLYTFTPRKVKYVSFVFRQRISYLDMDMNRYTIGIRDIGIYRLGFKNEGEFISTTFSMTDEIKKMILDTNQNPASPSILTSIDYFISPDNGQSWNAIQTKKFTGISGVESEIPEIINFNNTGVNAIETPVPVTDVRIKGVFKRNDDVFDDGSVVLDQ